MQPCDYSVSERRRNSGDDRAVAFASHDESRGSVTVAGCCDNARPNGAMAGG